MLRACRESGAGQSIYLRGEAGIGKTRWSRSSDGRPRTQGFAFHLGLVLDFGAGTGRDAIRALVRSLLGLEGRSEPGSRPRGGRARVRRRSARRRAPGPPQRSPGSAAAARAARALRRHGQRAGAAAASARRWPSWSQSASARRPLLLVVEDVHWADRATLEHLASLAQAVAAAPALLVMTSRVEGDPLDPAWRAALDGSPLLTIDLGPLRPKEAEALAGGLSRGQPRVRPALPGAGGRQPLFLDQLLRHAEERDRRRRARTRCRAWSRPGWTSSTPADKQALLAAAVFGQRFSLDAPALPDRAPATTTARPWSSSLLVRPEGDEFLFAHALIRDAVYDMLLKASRRALHRRAAAWFEGQRLQRSTPSIWSGPRIPAAAAAYLAAAGQQARDSIATSRRSRLVERGLALAAEGRRPLRARPACRASCSHDLGAMRSVARGLRGGARGRRRAAHRCPRLARPRGGQAGDRRARRRLRRPRARGGGRAPA